MLDKLTKHHLGVVIDPAELPQLEAQLGKAFHEDATQGCRVAFRWNAVMGLHEEYIVREGRAAKYPLGFHHICYAVRDEAEMAALEAWLKEGRRGFRLTFPEQSGSAECGVISFWMIRGVGMAEFSLGGPVGQQAAS
ncbi:hypothetical protein [Magnetofaba australis]|uniref:VOC domain-containing protein n=1 Tax=Magnetofaba australis IT-1 TaxID=1434232 RepID=A0A1Y2K3D1_9PROT|nr:hypothetical protein [Magnetofaba australis]OSM02503.1 hypothetical protein MAIT1_02653 [Magnetofaba australis IT-1]